MNGYALKSKKILITGASGDIGLATARAFAEEGAELALFGNSAVEKLRSTAADIEKTFGVRTLCLGLDISDPSAVSSAVGQVLDKFGSIDILINNAGISLTGLDQDMSPADWNRLVGVNLSGCMYMCRALIPSMLRNGGGRIINISSVWGVAGASCEAAYSATKGGINTYTKALAKELAPSHIPVNAIAFGVIDTKMNAWLSDDERRDLEESIPYGRMATPDEAAMMIRTVCTAPDYMTGQIIGFDGGFI